MLENKLLSNISGNNSNNNINNKDYYIITLDSYGSNIDNIKFGEIQHSYIKNDSILKLSEFILNKGIVIINNCFKEDDSSEELSFSSNLSSYLINFLHGTSLFQDYDLLSLNNSTVSKDERNAVLLNLYHIMHIHYLIKEK